MTLCTLGLSEFHLTLGIRDDNISSDVLVIKPAVNFTLSSNSDQGPWSLNYSNASFYYCLRHMGAVHFNITTVHTRVKRHSKKLFSA